MLESTSSGRPALDSASSPNIWYVVLQIVNVVSTMLSWIVSRSRGNTAIADRNVGTTLATRFMSEFSTMQHSCNSTLILAMKTSIAGVPCARV
jgi:hypothetical protein